MTPKYRPDIDGLRAVAVLAIVFFHLDIPPFTGGYVGVDIFFVISGFLITSIIVRELQAGNFSIATFYERRVRRILPALAVVLVATLLLGLLLLNPAQLEDLGKAAAATTAFSSNIFFFLGAGYFDGPSELKPLLHTWSLAVEEQFYILFPFILILISRYAGGRFHGWLAGLALLSFAACVLVTPQHETAAFYLIPFRAWELLMGSILALQVIRPVESRALANVLSTVGLVLMLVAVFAYDRETAFPGAAAAVPTLGTALIIYAGTGKQLFVNRLLATKPMVFVGLISYSLYLWHWPAVVYAKHFLINELTDAEKTVVLVVILLVSTLSWRFVETPFRDRRRFAPRERLFAIAAAVFGVILSANLFVVSKGGLPDRNTDASLTAELVADPGWQHWKDCEEAGETDLSQLCGLGADEVEPSFLLWGDSHALALASAVNLSAKRQAASGLIAVRTACAPLLRIDRPGETSCAEFNDAILQYAVDHPELETVILAARWALSTNGTRYKKESGRSVTLVDIDVTGDVAFGNAQHFAAGLRRTVESLGSLGRRVVLVAQVPEVGFDVPSANYSAKLTGRDPNAMIAPTRAEYLARNDAANGVIAQLRGDHELVLVDPASLLCEEERCNVVEDGMPLYRDDNHLSLRGCVRVASLFDEVL